MSPMIDLRANPFFLNNDEIKQVESILAELTDQQKIGQLFCVMGQDYSENELQSLVLEYAIGGILFRPEPVERIRAKYTTLDAIAPVPLIKAANLEEGGSGAWSDGTFFGWPMGIAATADIGMCERFAQVCAVEGAKGGVNWTFSPVCDLDLNYRNPIVNVRSFGSDVDTVEQFALAYVQACQRSGVAACAKHFPGDGVDFRDQHLHPTYNSLSAAEWESGYGRIYRSLIEKGLLSVMVGHIVQPNIAMEINPSLSFEDCLPASLSPELLRGVLRGRFAFNGVITTDATIMGGFTQALPRYKAIPQAIIAGNDMLVFNTNFYEDYRFMLDALKDGRLTHQRLDEAVTRILALKTAMRREHILPEIQTSAWRKECAAKSITLVKNHQPKLIPVTPERYPRIRLIPLGNDSILDGSMTKLAKDYLVYHGFDVSVFNEDEAELHGVGHLDLSRLSIYLANLETASNQTVVRIPWCKKHALNAPRHPNEEPSVFISFANPYHLQDVPRIRTYINAYSCHSDTIYAALDKLMGNEEFSGVSPVDAYCGLLDARI